MLIIIFMNLYDLGLSVTDIKNLIYLAGRQSLEINMSLEI